MASALVALATTTLASSSATVTFSSISGAYRDLRLVVSGTATAGGNMTIIFNGDSGANYSYVQAYGTGSAAQSASSSANADFSGVFYTNPTIMTYDFMDYSATDKHKTNINRGSAASNLVSMSVGRWASTSAITRIDIGHGSGSYAAGTTFSLYGIASA